MLAWPYGSPDVHSGYEFTDNDAGPPHGGRSAPATPTAGSASTPGARSPTWSPSATRPAAQAVTNWWDNGGDQIAFGRGSKAYVAINHEGSALTRTFQTSLAAGHLLRRAAAHTSACTARVTVNSAGQFTATLPANGSVALHVGRPQRHGTPTPSPAPPPAPPLAASTPPPPPEHPRRRRPGRARRLEPGHGRARPGGLPRLEARRRPPGRHAFAYKYVRKDAAGNVTWEGGANRTATVPASGKVTLTDTWRN